MDIIQESRTEQGGRKMHMGIATQQPHLLQTQTVHQLDRMTRSNPVSLYSSGSLISGIGVSSPPLPHLSHSSTESWESIPAFEGPRLHRRGGSLPDPSLHNQGSKGQKWEKSQADIAEQAKHEAEIEHRIAELKKEGFWSLRRLSKVPEPIRPKVHWDYLCEEMQWLAADFAQERRWKRGVARKVVRMVIRHHEEQKQKEEKAKREEQAKLRRIASSIAKEIRMFWANVEKVVHFKQQSRLEEKRKKALDLQLDFIVGQTEKYSDLLSQSLNECVPSAARETGSSLPGSSQAASPVSSPQPFGHGQEEEDGDFQPHEEEDDEETIEVEEQQEGNDAETQWQEVELLRKESELPLEELLQSLAPQMLANSHHILSSTSEDDEDEEEKLTKSLKGKLPQTVPRKASYDEQEEEDEEFTANEEEAEDEEETIEAEEELAGEQDHMMELDELTKEGEMSLSELLQKYSTVYSADLKKNASESSSCSIFSESEQSDEEEEESSIQTDFTGVEMEKNEVVSDQEKDIGMEYLLKEDDEWQDGRKNVDLAHTEPHGPKKEITDIAATAESLQPKGYTLATTQVKTPIPFLLRGTLREYQHIGLDWLVTMYEKKLNGILADEMGLGKTIQTISLLAHLACEKGNWGPHLIIVPTSVMLNWEMEFKRWCPSFKILTYFGAQKERKLKRQGWTKPNAFHVCITSYKLVLQDHQAFRRKNWKYLILDEAQNIKNFKSQRWQSLLNFNSQRRLLLTGTPLQNSLMELWSLMHFLMPHVFQSHREFKEWFSNPLTGMIEGSQEYNESLIKRLHKVLRPFLLRRVKVDVEKQMPKKYEHVIRCRLSKRQRYLYDDFMAQAATRETLVSGHFMSVINILMQLRKVCNHPNLFDPRPIHSPFITEGICFNTASLVLQALEKDPFKNVDLCMFDLINMEGRVSRYETDIFLPSHKATRGLIEEIAESPDPPPRPKPVKMKVNRMFQPIPRPDGRTLVLVNSPRAPPPSSPMPSLPELTPNFHSGAPVLPPNDFQQNFPAIPLPEVTLPVSISVPTPSLPPPLPAVVQPPPVLLPAPAQQNSTAMTMMTTATSVPPVLSAPQVFPASQLVQAVPQPLTPPLSSPLGATGVKPSTMATVRSSTAVTSTSTVVGTMKSTPVLPGYTFPSAGGTMQQRVILSPDMQARLPSGEVVSIAQLASLANKPLQGVQGNKPITFQLQGNKLTLTGTQVRHVNMGLPRQLQGGQHHIISPPTQVALIQAMAQQQQPLQSPTTQLQQSGQAQVGVQAMALQPLASSHQPAILPSAAAASFSTSAGFNVPSSATQGSSSLGNSASMVKIVVRQAPRDGLPSPSLQQPLRPSTPLLPSVPLQASSPPPGLTQPLMRALQSPVSGADPAAPAVPLATPSTTQTTVGPIPTPSSVLTPKPVTVASLSVHALTPQPVTVQNQAPAPRPGTLATGSVPTLAPRPLPPNIAFSSSGPTLAPKPVTLATGLVSLPTPNCVPALVSRPTTLISSPAPLTTPLTPTPPIAAHRPVNSNYSCAPILAPKSVTNVPHQAQPTVPPAVSTLAAQPLTTIANPVSTATVPRPLPPIVTSASTSTSVSVPRPLTVIATSACAAAAVTLPRPLSPVTTSASLAVPVTVSTVALRSQTPITTSASATSLVTIQKSQPSVATTVSTAAPLMGPTLPSRPLTPVASTAPTAASMAIINSLPRLSTTISSSVSTLMSMVPMITSSPAHSPVPMVIPNSVSTLATLTITSPSSLPGPTAVASPPVFPISMEASNSSPMPVPLTTSNLSTVSLSKSVSTCTPMPAPTVVSSSSALSVALTVSCSSTLSESVLVSNSLPLSGPVVGSSSCTTPVTMAISNSLPVSVADPSPSLLPVSMTLSNTAVTQLPIDVANTAQILTSSPPLPTKPVVLGCKSISYPKAVISSNFAPGSQTPISASTATSRPVTPNPTKTSSLNPAPKPQIASNTAMSSSLDFLHRPSVTLNLTMTSSSDSVLKPSLAPNLVAAPNYDSRLMSSVAPNFAGTSDHDPTPTTRCVLTALSPIIKEELETLSLRSTALTPPPPSTSFMLQRARRQPPPPPRSPFYLESLEETRKKQKEERLERLFRISEQHCVLSPIYGTEVLRLCSLFGSPPGVGYAYCQAAQLQQDTHSLAVYWQQTEALTHAILQPQQRMEQLMHIIERFIFVMPPVEAPAISLHSSHPPPSLLLQKAVFQDTLRRELSPHASCLHRIICNMHTQFPDLRLIQYDCGKLQTLDRLLRQLKVGNHRVLIFTQMTRMLDVLEQFLNYHGHIYLRLDGSTRVEQRQALMERFNADKRIFCFILSTRSGGVGVNLTGADTVIFYDSDWNPTMDAQAQDRCHRIGQTRDVHIYRLISERTVEENILKKANQKRMLGDMAIEGGNFTTAYFRQQTIRELFDMPVEELGKKETEKQAAFPEEEEEDGTSIKQTQILEQALCKAEDEEDIQAATQAKAEQVAELAEFNENIPLDVDDGLGREEEEEMSRAEQEIAALVEQLTPIERYAMNFLEASLEEICKEELKQAEEQVEAARKDLDQAKDEVFRLPEEEEEIRFGEESHIKKNKKAKNPHRLSERMGTRVSERLRGVRLPELGEREFGASEFLQTRQEAKRLSMVHWENSQPRHSSERRLLRAAIQGNEVPAIGERKQQPHLQWQEVKKPLVLDTQAHLSTANRIPLQHKSEDRVVIFQDNKRELDETARGSLWQSSNSLSERVTQKQADMESKPILPPSIFKPSEEEASKDILYGRALVAATLEEQATQLCKGAQINQSEDQKSHALPVANQVPLIQSNKTESVDGAKGQSRDCTEDATIGCRFNSQQPLGHILSSVHFLSEASKGTRECLSEWQRLFPCDKDTAEHKFMGESSNLQEVRQNIYEHNKTYTAAQTIEESPSSSQSRDASKCQQGFKGLRMHIKNTEFAPDYFSPSLAAKQKRSSMLPETCQSLATGIAKISPSDSELKTSLGSILKRATPTSNHSRQAKELEKLTTLGDLKARETDKKENSCMGEKRGTEVLTLAAKSFTSSRSVAADDKLMITNRNHPGLVVPDEVWKNKVEPKISHQNSKDPSIKDMFQISNMEMQGKENFSVPTESALSSNPSVALRQATYLEEQGTEPPLSPEEKQVVCSPADAEKLKESPCGTRTPRRRTTADSEILQSQKDDSPTAKVLRKLPGRLVTVVEEREPVKRRRNRSKTGTTSPEENSANSPSDMETSSKEMPVLRNLPIRRRIELETRAAAAAGNLSSIEKPEIGSSHLSFPWVEMKIIEQDDSTQSMQNPSQEIERPTGNLELASRMPTRHRPNREVSTRSPDPGNCPPVRQRLSVEDEAFSETLEMDCKILPLSSSGERLEGDSSPTNLKRKRGRPPKFPKSETSLEIHSPEQSPIPESLLPDEMNPQGKAVTECGNSKQDVADNNKLSPETQATANESENPSAKNILSLALKTPPSAESESISSAGSPAEKRKRGRPPKMHLPASPGYSPNSEKENPSFSSTPNTPLTLNKKLKKEEKGSPKHSDSQAADSGDTPQKRKRGRPPKIETPPQREKSCLSPISNEESSFDEASNLRHQAKKPIRKKKRKAPGEDPLRHKVRGDSSVGQQIQTDSESSSEVEGKRPPPRKLGKQETITDKRGLDSGNEASDRITRRHRTDSDSEAVKPLPSKQDAKSDKAIVTWRPDDSSSLESSASELKSPPKGRCTRQRPGDLMPALESEKKLTKLPPRKRQNSSDESSSGQNRARAESGDETLSEDDDRPQKRLRSGIDVDSESEKLKKKKHVYVSENSVNRVLRSVAAAAAAAATTPAGNTRSSSFSITTPPTAPSPTLGRKSGAPTAAVTSSLSHRGRKPKT
uniref:Helicase SRCAP isoform X2 n=1 Tax=Geotrypetes seraphini TaxID=260995 RepID=A0A6P8QYN3_GEOSA|nr:helicase SRCAP isoform X2 [Geotrypetes seraphini]